MINLDVCYCIGSGANYKYLVRLNEEHAFFKKIVPLEHPRYIMQYHRSDKEHYVDKYLDVLRREV